MGLANEGHPNTQPSEEYLFQLTQMKAARLASQMIRGETNSDPREAVSPARGVHIRRLVPVRRTPVDDHCRTHNSNTEDLGSPGWAELWRSRR